MNNTVRIVKTQNVLKSYREHNKLTRQQLRKKLRCSYSLVQLIECGYRQITPGKALECELILGIPREQLCPDIFGERAA